jgi:hypothetical protein
MSDARTWHRQSKSYGYVLLVLLLIFCARVLAQLIQALFPVGFLPPFEAWQSGAVPYPVLILFQILIIIVCIRVVWGVLSGTTVHSAKKGRLLRVLGWVYLIVMSVRLVVGLTLAPEHFWFGAKLPTVFHLVLASFLLVCGSFHSARPATLVPRNPELCRD